MTKATFDSQDAHSAIGVTEAGVGKKYTGVERRRSNRRSGNERRAEVRFDPNNPDRRQNKGRREDDQAPNFW